MKNSTVQRIILGGSIAAVIGPMLLIMVVAGEQVKFKADCHQDGGLMTRESVWAGGPRNPILRCIIDGKVVRKYQYVEEDVTDG